MRLARITEHDWQVIDDTFAIHAINKHSGHTMCGSKEIVKDEIAEGANWPTCTWCTEALEDVRDFCTSGRTVSRPLRA
jgi:hypothetical protein